MRSALFRSLLSLAFVVGAFFTPAASASEVQVPKNDGRVTDLAHMLSASDEQTLEQELEAWKRGSGHEIAVLTVPNLQGDTPEHFALLVGRTWGLGSKEKSDGALLLIARDEHKIRIEVGRGLEGLLPDITCGRIIRDVITPAFKRGEFSRGIRDGVAQMRAVIGGDSSQLPPEHEAGSESVGAIVVLVFVIGFIMFIAMRRASKSIGGPRSRGTGGWGGGWGGFGGWSVGGGGGGSSGGGGFSGFGGGGGFSGGGASGGW